MHPQKKSRGNEARAKHEFCGHFSIKRNITAKIKLDNCQCVSYNIVTECLEQFYRNGLHSIETECKPFLFCLHSPAPRSGSREEAVKQ